jgi:hypothetical protein
MPAQRGMVAAEHLHHHHRHRPVGRNRKHGGQMGLRARQVERVFLDTAGPVIGGGIDNRMVENARLSGLRPGAIDLGLEGRAQVCLPRLPGLPRQPGRLQRRTRSLAAMARGYFGQGHGDTADQHQRQGDNQEKRNETAHGGTTSRDGR